LLIYLILQILLHLLTFIQFLLLKVFLYRL